MKSKILLIILLLTVIHHVKADEGMWMISNLSSRTDSILHSMGLELSQDELYSTEQPSLNDAVVIFGGFCSGVVVSNDGLVFTNHHCGFNAINEHTTVKHNYLKNGFIANSYKEELPSDGLYVLFHLKTIDVTDRVLSQVDDSMTVKQRLNAIKEAVYSIEKEVDDNTDFIYGVVKSYNRGNKFYLSIYQRYNDVRLVFAPPRSLGQFGGDTDNWEWPRQTCDFSVFRIYAGKNNQPADYNKNNQPFHPKRYAQISVKGYQPGAFCMTLGFPGSTERYLSSYGIESNMTTINDIIYKVRNLKLGILDKAMKADEETDIKYASRYFSSSNHMKYAYGQNEALKNLKVADEKKELEKEVNEWIINNNESKYLGVLDSLKKQYENNFEKQYTYILLVESFTSGSDILNYIINKVMVHNVTKDKAFRKNLKEFYDGIDIELDKKVFAAMAKNYLQMSINQQNRPDFFDEIDSCYGGDIDAFTDALYAKSKLGDKSRYTKIRNVDDIISDPFFDIAISIRACLSENYPNRTEIEQNERVFEEALREMNKDKELYPDANFTLRLSYGTIKPLNNNYATYPQSLINKSRKQPVSPEYQLIPEVEKWLNDNDFGEQYLDDTHNLPLCFITNNDITGGNSGSGIFNGKGQLIGLAFDGNWEAMSSDFKFDTNLQRCIGVDIRYVLSVIEDYGKAKRLINELSINY